MAGRGAWRDDMLGERLWRIVKYELISLKTYDSISAAWADIADYIELVQYESSSLESQWCDAWTGVSWNTAKTRAGRIEWIPWCAQVATRPDSTHKSGKDVQSTAATSLH